MQILPLRNMVLVRPQNGTNPSSPLVVIAPERAICRFVVIGVGPEVRDVKPEQIVLANRLAGTSIGSELLIPESTILGTL